MKKKMMGIILVFAMVFLSVFGSISSEAAAKSVKLNKKTVTMTVGTKYSLKVKNLPKNAKVTWASSDKKKAAVSRKGTVKAKKAGSVMIRSKVSYSQNGKRKTKKLSCKIKINKKMNLGKTLVVYFSVPEMDSKKIQRWMRSPVQVLRYREIKM